MNAPSTAVSASAMWNMNSFGRSVVRSAPQIVAGTHSSAVSATRNRFSPSMPSW